LSDPAPSGRPDEAWQQPIAVRSGSSGQITATSDRVTVDVGHDRGVIRGLGTFALLPIDPRRAAPLR